MEISRFKPFLLGLGIIVGAFVVVFALKALKPQTEKEEATKPPLVVRVVDAVHKEQVVFSTFQGEVRAKTDIELVTQVTGKVMSVSENFIEGGQFQAGEVLLQIDDADYQVALKSAQASVATAQVDLDIELATAATNKREWRELQGRPIEEANPLRLNKPQIDRAKARLDAANAELAAAKLNYNRTKLSAPFDGRIMSKSAELGQFMSRGSSIGRVFATQTMEVRIPMTDIQVSELGLSMGYSAKAEGTQGLPATVTTLFGLNQYAWPGFVKSVDASIDSKTRLLFATVVVDQSNKQAAHQVAPLAPGLFVDVQLSSPTKLSGLQVPRTALRNGNQVYVYQGDKLVRKSVKTVYTSRDMVILSEDQDSELILGDKVITSPVPGAYEGMPVKLPDSLSEDKTKEGILEEVDENVAEGSLEGTAEGSLVNTAEGSLASTAEGSLTSTADGSLASSAEGSLEGIAEGLDPALEQPEEPAGEGAIVAPESDVSESNTGSESVTGQG